MNVTAANKPRTGYVRQYGYPVHTEDSGPLLPTTDHGLVCAKCHRVWTEPDGIQYAAARDVHRDADCEPVNVNRPQPRGPADLTEKERKALASCKAGNGHRLAEGTAAPLVMLRLVTEQIGKGRDGKDRVEARTLTDAGRVLADACEEAAKPADNVMMFDLGAPDPAALRRIDDAKAEAARRRSEKAKGK